MDTLQQLQPHKLWQWFATICSIPHPSYHEEQLAEYIVNWAKQRALWVERDEVGNILIRKSATSGMQLCKKVALQAHLDMVPQKNNATEHDFTKDPIQAVIDGEWVKASGTTLGADNGIGMASALTVLDSDDIAHPDLEVLLTMTEESGMDGANGLRENWLQSEWLINTDTEENGEIYVGCAGGINASVQLPLTYTENQFTNSFTVELKGLCGGHSGCDIHRGRANAIKMLSTILAFLQQQDVDFAIQKISGGTLRNAIPREAGVEIATDCNEQLLQQLLGEIETGLVDEWGYVESNLQLTLTKCDSLREVLSELCTQKVVALLNALPSGVVRNSDHLPGVVETSLSLGVLDIQDRTLYGTFLIRSLIESGKQHIMLTLRSVCRQFGGTVDFDADYPGWVPELDSPLLNLTEACYAPLLEKPAEIKVIHAGLECGILQKHYPNILMVSIGPTILNAHSPDEKVSITGVAEYWRLLTALLSKIPQA